MSWEPGISIPTRSRCGVCHKVSPVEFSVPNSFWKIAVPDYFRNAVVCLQCFISFADERLLAWDEVIKFYPKSLRTHIHEVRKLRLTEERES